MVGTASSPWTLLLMTQGCSPLGHLWQPPNTCGLKSPPALPEKDTYGFGVAHLLRDPNLNHGRVTFAESAAVDGPEL